MPGVRIAALQCIDECGRQCEREHPDETLERPQFGVDGADGIDYDGGHLPTPFFARRPGLAARLFVRANARRFFPVALAELSNWREETRKRSADLLLVLTVYCEEYLTKYFRTAVDAIAAALDVERASRCENDHLKILDAIQRVLRSMAKYVDPVTYLPVICPRITNEDSTVSENSATHDVILSSLIEGAPAHLLLPHWLALAGTRMRTESLNALLTYWQGNGHR